LAIVWTSGIVRERICVHAKPVIGRAEAEPETLRVSVIRP
jgi:hypothetical protein